jgi:hypothetical protein
MFGKVAGFAANKAGGEGVVRVTLDGYDPSILDLGQQAAGVGTILRANSAFPHSWFSSTSLVYFEKIWDLGDALAELA